MRQKISAHVDGGLSGGSSVRRPGSEDPHPRERKFSILKIGLFVHFNKWGQEVFFLYFPYLWDMAAFVKIIII